MALNKKEDTFTKIPNGVLEALAKYNIPGNTRRCLDVIMRKTWGWHKDEDTITNSQIERETELDKSNVSKSIKWLIDRRIIFVGKNTNKRGKSIRINEKTKTWKKPAKRPKKAVGKNAKKALVDLPPVVCKNANKTLVNTPNTKEINKKNILNKGANPKPELRKDSGLRLPHSDAPKSEEEREKRIAFLRRQGEQLKKNETTNT